MTDNNIILKPKFLFWLTSYSFFIVLVGIVIFLSKTYDQYEFVKPLGAIISLTIFIFLFYKYIDMLICTKWIVTDEQILIKKGVFAKSVNYLELYRVFDYEEKKSFIQALCRNTSIYIHSGDKSHPILCMYGLQKDDTIISTIRQRVERQREVKRIYEFTNQ